MPDQSIVKVMGIKGDLNLLLEPVRNLILGAGPSTYRETTLISTTDLRQLINTTAEILRNREAVYEPPYTYILSNGTVIAAHNRPECGDCGELLSATRFVKPFSLIVIDEDSW